MRCLTVAVLVLLGSSAEATEWIRTSDQGRTVEIQARGVPLASLLDQLEERTGMQVEFRGERPNKPVTVEISGTSHAEAVMRLLQGRRLNFALVMDAEGRRVEKLLFMGAAPARSARSVRRGRRRTPTRPGRRPRRQITPAEPLLDDDDLGGEAAEVPQAPTPPAASDRSSGVGYRSSFPRSSFTPAAPNTALPVVPEPASPGPSQDDQGPQ